MPAPTKTPKTKAEFEAVLQDKDALNTLFAEDRFGDFVRDYAAAWNAENTDIQDRVEAEVQRGLAAFLKDNGQKLRRPDLTTPTNGTQKGVSTGKGAVYNKAAPGAKIDQSEHAPADMAQFLQATWHHAASLPNGDELRAQAGEWRKIQNSFGSTVPADGGFLIPEDLRSELLQLALENTVVRQRATVIPMSSLAVPIPMVDDTSHASSVFGGIVAYWTEEGAQATESQAKFGRARLEAKKLTIYCEAPNELVADAPAFGGFLDNVLPQALAFYEDDGFTNGTGVGEPKGWLSGDATISVTRAAGGNAIDFDDVVNMYARMLPQSLNRAVWVASPKCIISLLKLVYTVAAGDSVSPPLWLTGGQAIDAPTMTLLGRPVLITEKVPNAGTAGDLSFVDFGYYLIGDRQVAQSTSSPHFKFSSDVTAYKITERVDGRPWLSSPLTPKNGGDTLSPFVKLN